MEQYEREKRALNEMNGELDESMASSADPQNRQIQEKHPSTPFEELRKLVNDVQTSVRRQQLKAEQSIQQTLQQAATYLSDAEKLDTMTKQVQAMQQALRQQGPTNNPTAFRETLQQLRATICEQLHQADQQAAQSLQQTVSSLARSQAAMFDSQSFAEMAEMLKQCDRTLTEWQRPERDTVH